MAVDRLALGPTKCPIVRVISSCGFLRPIGLKSRCALWTQEQIWPDSGRVRGGTTGATLASTWEFYALAVIVGMVQGARAVLSRSLFAR